MIRITFYTMIITLLATLSLWAQDSGTLAGKVRDVETNQGIKEAIIKLSDTDSVKFTAKDGSFQFTSLPEGEYSITLQAPGYGRTIYLGIPVFKGEVTYKDIYLKKGAEEGQNFYIGGIEVSAERELLPEKPSTTTNISSGEIEHLQASSLGDVLELIPGQKFTNPGLEDVKQIRIRSTETTDQADNNTALGTQIVVDDVPLSNNANMQLDTKLNDGANYRVTVNSGVDLRRIPAENIKSVEIIRGIPPARYGDLTSGTVLVHTQSGLVPFRSKYKYNPRNKELNVSGGYGNEAFESNFTFNYAKSVRNIRVPGDSYQRIYAQLNFINHFFDKKMRWTNRLYFTRTFDEQDLREGDITQTTRYNRSYTGRLNTGLTYEWNRNKVLDAIFSANMDRENSYYNTIVSRDPTVISTRLTPGTQEGYFVSVYQSDLRVRGRAWNLYGRVEYKNQLQKGGMIHQWLTGVDIRHEFNNGPGREFDPLYPPRTSSSEGDRPRSYNDIPGLSQYTIYFQDEITGHLWRDFTLQLGLRYEMFDPYNLDWSRLKDGKNPVESHQGNFLSPRINFVQYLSPNTQIRMGYGRTAKIPPLSMLYPNPLYFDVVDSMYYDPDTPENRFAAVTTYVYNIDNQDLKGFTQDKYELSLDQRIKNMGFSLTGFYERMHDGFNLGGYIPVSFEKYYYPNWPNLSAAIPRDTVLSGYSTALNSVESISKGIELAISSKKIPYINTSIRVDAAYHFTKSWYQNNYYERATSLRNDPNLNQTVRPFWNPLSSWSDDIVIHYRFDTIAKPLGLWFTLSIQQVAMERDKLRGLGDSLAVGYITESGQQVFIPEQERSDAKYENMRRVYEPYNFVAESRPDYWLVNLRVSKGLWPGAEVSFFVNNMFNSRPLYQRKRVPEGSLSYTILNPEMFYGLEFSMVVDDLVNFIKRY